jgi:anti-sigma B factor antagonist
VGRSSGAAPPLSSGGSGEPKNGQVLTVRVEAVGPRASVVSLAGELDLSTIPHVENQLFDQLRSQAAIVVDLTDVTFIDSSGIALLIQSSRATNDTGVLNTVIAEGSQVERVFRLAGIDRALPLFTQRVLALEGVNGAVGD